jgi:hypothetical protein
MVFCKVWGYWNASQKGAFTSANNIYPKMFAKGYDNKL